MKFLLNCWIKGIFLGLQRHNLPHTWKSFIFDIRAFPCYFFESVIGTNKDWQLYDSSQSKIIIYVVINVYWDFSGRVEGLAVQAVDTNGAGDAFVSGILSQLAKDLTLLQVRFNHK